MGRLYFEPARAIAARAGCMLGLIFVLHAVPLAAQHTAQPQRQVPRPQDQVPDDPGTRLQAAQAQKRKVERQKQIVTDSDKLLLLAQELKAEVDKSSSDTLSLTVLKKSEEIEKLAKSLKSQVKNSE